MRPVLRLVAGAIRLVAVVAVVLGAAQSAAAAVGEHSPSVTTSSAGARLGQSVVVTLAGFHGGGVTLAVCGNLAGRGSSDCDVSHSIGVGTTGPSPGPTLIDFTITSPPVPCPCVVLATGVTGAEAASTPIAIGDVGQAPLAASGSVPALAVTARLRDGSRSVTSRLRALLGGRETRSVEVTVRNTRSESLDRVAFGGAVGKGTDLTPFWVPTVAPLAGGEERSYTIPTTLAAPAWGRYTWEVAAFGAGPAQQRRLSERIVPWGLVVLVAALTVDLTAFGVVRVRRRGAAA